MPHPLPLPADLSVKALAEWLRPMRLIGPAATCALQARAVRALLADVARKAVESCAVDCDGWAGCGDPRYAPGAQNSALSIRTEADDIVSRILGAEVAP